MMRQVLGVIAGYAAWTAVWLGGGAGFRSVWPELDGVQSITATAPLLSLLGLSLACSLLAGFTTRRLAAKSGAVLVMALLLIATGIGVQMSVWELMPVWYHLAFLVLLLPVATLGGRLGATSP